jgi:hypothetical protein
LRKSAEENEPDWEGVKEGWGIFHDKKLHNLNCTPNVTRANKSKRMKWAGLVGRLEGMRNAYKI